MAYFLIFICARLNAIFLDVKVQSGLEDRFQGVENKLLGMSYISSTGTPLPGSKGKPWDMIIKLDVKMPACKH